MKNLLKKIALLSVVMLVFGCSKDSPTSNTAACTPIPCLNGGTSTSNCGCICPQGFTGSNCGTQITPTKILISKIRVNYFPNYDNGSFWDPSLPTASLASPDIYVTLQDASSNVLFNAPTYFANVTSNGSNYYDFTPTTPIILPIASVYSYFQINLWDYDGADSNISSSDDFMGSRSFYPYSSTGGFPSTITVSDSSYTVSFTLTLSYVW
jgi:hypothetical protein